MEAGVGGRQNPRNLTRHSSPAAQTSVPSARSDPGQQTRATQKSKHKRRGWQSLGRTMRIIHWATSASAVAVSSASVSHVGSRLGRAVLPHSPARTAVNPPASTGLSSRVAMYRFRDHQSRVASLPAVLASPFGRRPCSSQTASPARFWIANESGEGTSFRFSRSSLRPPDFG